MRKTAKGRWVPDKPPPKPEPKRLDLSYESYLMCAYSHPIPEGTENCAWCGPDRISPTMPPPWYELERITFK